MKPALFLLTSLLGLSFAQAQAIPGLGPTVIPVVDKQGIPLAPSDYAKAMVPSTLEPNTGRACKVASGFFTVPVGNGDARKPLTVVSKSPAEMLSGVYVAPDIVNVPYVYTSQEQVDKYLHHITKVTEIPYTEMLRTPAVNAFIAMADKARSEGVAIKIHSGYRPFDTQCGTFNFKIGTILDAPDSHFHRGVKEDELSVIKDVNTRSAYPGSSEHQLGTAMDIVGYIPSGPHMGWKLEFEMDQTLAFKWLAGNAWKYGFVLSYPRAPGADPAAVNPRTGYVYEPWHWRYIGVVPATRYIACSVSRGMTTQEFLRALNKDPKFSCAAK